MSFLEDSKLRLLAQINAICATMNAIKANPSELYGIIKDLDDEELEDTEFDAWKIEQEGFSSLLRIESSRYNENESLSIHLHLIVAYDHVEDNINIDLMYVGDEWYDLTDFNRHLKNVVSDAMDKLQKLKVGAGRPVRSE